VCLTEAGSSARSDAGERRVGAFSGAGEQWVGPTRVRVAGCARRDAGAYLGRLASESRPSRVRVASESRPSRVLVASESRPSRVRVASESRPSRVRVASESRPSRDLRCLAVGRAGAGAGAGRAGRGGGSGQAEARMEEVRD
jgi:hypothetical protein